MRTALRLIALTLLLTVSAFTHFGTSVGAADDGIMIEESGCTDSCDRNVVACCQTYGSNGSCPQSCSDKYLACLSKC